jgi:hypothetical protein
MHRSETSAAWYTTRVARVQRGTFALMLATAIAVSGSADLQAERLPLEILSLERRASGLGGSLQVTSSSGSGTRATFRIPIT